MSNKQVKPVKPTKSTLLEQFMDVDGNWLPRPESKSRSDIERLLTLGKPLKVIEKFADLVSESLRWEYLDQYLQYEEDAKYYEANKTEHMVEPITPIDYVHLTGAEIMKEYYPRIFKEARTSEVASLTVEYDGKEFQADEASTARMLKAVTVLTGKEHIYWKLANNATVKINQTDLKKVLRLCVLKHSDIINTTKY